MQKIEHGRNIAPPGVGGSATDTTRARLLSRALFLAIALILGIGTGLYSFPDNTAAGSALIPAERRSEPGHRRIAEEEFSRWFPLSLRGEWHFLPDQFVRPDPAWRDASLEWMPLPVPGSWEGTLDGTGPYGIGTYRLTVTLPDYGGELGLLIPDQAIAYRCYLDGQLVAANGEPGDTYSATRVTREPRLVSLGNAAGPRELLFHVANHHYDVGGIINSPRIGEYRILAILRDGKTLFTGVFSGALLVIALYYLLLYFQQSRWRRDEASLLFALFCLVVFVRVLTVSHLPERLAGSPRIFEGSIRLEFISLYVAVPLYVAVLSKLFAMPRVALVFRVTGLFAAAASLFVLVLPVPDFTRLTLRPFQLLTVATSLYILANLILSSRRGESEAPILLGGFALFFLLIVNDILHAALLVRTAHLMPVGMLLFVLAHFVVLTRRHAGAETRTRELAAALARERDSLDDRVRERTTELELANDRLRREEEARLEFVATISHELRTPLTLITTPLEQAARGKYGTELTVDGTVLRSIRRNAQRIETLIENLLDYSRFELGRLVPQNVPVALDELVASLVAELEPVAEEKELQLHFRTMHTGGVWIAGDPRLLELALFNLLSNALKFTPAGGRVEVSLGQGGTDGPGGPQTPAGPDSSVWVRVADTGVGISEADMPHIFEKFYRGCVEVDGSRPGSGIGLPLTRTIMDLHQGNLYARSTPGEGSVFTIVLPLTEQGDTPARDTPGVTRHGTARTPLTEPTPVTGSATAAPIRHTVLVAEDNRELLAYIADALKEEYNVLCAGDGVEALKQIRGPERPDIVITDIMMPGMDGAELFEQVHREGHFPDLPFLFLTARTDRPLETRLRSAGAVAYIRKPFDMEKLQLKIRSLLRLRTGIRAHTENEYARRLKAFLGLETGASPGVAGIRTETMSALTEREHQICSHLVQGLTDKEIGTALGISGRTVSNTLTRLYRKYGVTNRTELTALLGRTRN